MQWLASWVPTGTHLPILRGPLRGRWWVAGASAGAGKGLSILVNGCEAREMEVLDALVPRGGVAFDLGANVGLYSLLLSRRCSRVYAFEPLPRNVRFLERTLAANRVRNVTVVPWAVSDGLALSALQEGANCALSALASGGGQPVVTISCDEFVQRYGVVPHVLKVDVEGAEAAVLRGARRLLAKGRPLVLLSTHGPTLHAECTALMRQAGYSEPRTLSADRRTGGSTVLWLPRHPTERAAREQTAAPASY
jgi:FkbM family methyltransferase